MNTAAALTILADPTAGDVAIAQAFKDAGMDGAVIAVAFAERTATRLLDGIPGSVRWLFSALIEASRQYLISADSDRQAVLEAARNTTATILSAAVFPDAIWSATDGIRHFAEVVVAFHHHGPEAVADRTRCVWDAAELAAIPEGALAGSREATDARAAVSAQLRSDLADAIAAI